MIDFTRPEHTVGRAQLFFGVMAYPELGAGASEGAQGAKFASALGSYFTWAVRQQYGLAALRARDISPEQKEHWEGILRRGGRRIRRRVNSLRIWRAATFPRSPDGGDVSLRAELSAAKYSETRGSAAAPVAASIQMAVPIVASRQAIQLSPEGRPHDSRLPHLQMLFDGQSRGQSDRDRIRRIASGREGLSPSRRMKLSSLAS